MKANLNIRGIAVGLAAIGFGIYIIVDPPDNLLTFPNHLRVFFIAIIFLYGIFRLVRGIWSQAQRNDPRSR